MGQGCDGNDATNRNGSIIEYEVHRCGPHGYVVDRGGPVGLEEPRPRRRTDREARARRDGVGGLRSRGRRGIRGGSERQLREQHLGAERCVSISGLGAIIDSEKARIQLVENRVQREVAGRDRCRGVERNVTPALSCGKIVSWNFAQYPNVAERSCPEGTAQRITIEPPVKVLSPCSRLSERREMFPAKRLTVIVCRSATVSVMPTPTESEGVFRCTSP